MIGVPELKGHLFVGRTKEGFSLSKVMVGYTGWTMERQMAIDVIPILADGIKWLGYLPKQKILWNIGAYGDWLSKNESFLLIIGNLQAEWRGCHHIPQKKISYYTSV
jgi:phosphate-selective porin OprO/OprP